MRAIDRLIHAIEEKANPTVLGLDTRYDYLPDAADLSSEADWQRVAAEKMWAYNKAILDALVDIVPAVKIQIAYYEMCGLWGMKLFHRCCEYAAKQGYFVIADAKRGDIGPTAGAYATAFLGTHSVGGQDMSAFPCDMLTVNPYFGSDGILPFVEECGKNDRGVFVLVKTSNPSSGEFQDLLLENGQPLYARVAEKVAEWGQSSIGEHGYSDVGAVVGATYPSQGRALRQAHPELFFLVPGYGAQGATADDLADCFDAEGRGALVNASRSLLLAYRKQEGVNWIEATQKEALRMKEDLNRAIAKRRDAK